MARDNSPGAGLANFVNGFEQSWTIPPGDNHLMDLLRPFFFSYHFFFAPNRPSAQRAFCNGEGMPNRRQKPLP